MQSSGSDIRLNFVIKTDSSQSKPLTQEELLKSRPNSRIFTLDATDPKNPADKKLQFFSTYSPLRIGGAIPITLHNGVWHQLTNPKEPWLDTPMTSIHNYDIKSDTSKGKGKSLPDTEDNIDKSLQKVIDQSIRESPLAPNTLLPPQAALILDIPLMSMTTMAPTEMVGFMVVAPTQEEHIKKAFGKAMKKYNLPYQPPPGGGGPPGGGEPSGGGFPRGGGSPVGGAPAVRQPLIANQDNRPIGSPPSTFHSNRALANNFLDKIKLYFHLNWACPSYQSAITQATFTLTYIKGEQVAGWVRDFGEFLDNLDPTNDDGPIVWDHFLDAFQEQFQDSTKENRARNELEKLQLKLPFIDEYTSKFKELARQVGYLAGNPETCQLFLHGLPRNILEEVMRGGAPLTYQDLKQRAVEAVWSRQTIDNIIQWRDHILQNPFQNAGCPCPFYAGPNRYDNYRGQNCPQQQQWNLSNTPQCMNNTLVPMDLNRTRTNHPQRGRGYQGYQGCIAALNKPGGAQTYQPLNRAPNWGPRGACFECGQMGHFARNCPHKRKQANINLLKYEEDDPPLQEPLAPVRDKVVSVKH